MQLLGSRAWRDHSTAIRILDWHVPLVALWCLALGLAILGYEKVACHANDWSAVFPSRSRLLTRAGGTTVKSCLWLDENEDMVEGSTLNLAMAVGMERGREGRGGRRSFAKMTELHRNPELGEGKESPACGTERGKAGVW